MSEHTHDDHHGHAIHPVAGTIVGLILTAVFGYAFAALNGGSISTGVVIAFVLLAGLMLTMMWVVDNNDESA